MRVWPGCNSWKAQARHVASDSGPIGKLKKLVFLAVDYNRLASLPSEIGGASRLREAYVLEAAYPNPLNPTNETTKGESPSRLIDAKISESGSYPVA